MGNSNSSKNSSRSSTKKEKKEPKSLPTGDELIPKNEEPPQRYVSPPSKAPLPNLPPKIEPQIICPPTGITDLEIQAAIKEGKKIVRAFHEYTSSNSSDLSFNKGDVMEIINEDGEWWYATNMATQEKGFIPSTYVVLENSLGMFNWYHDEVSRSESEQRLQAHGNIRGTYLVRVSQTTTGAYTMSVLDEDANRVKCVRHYRIKHTDLGKCFITTKRTFVSLAELVEFYQQKSEGLCCTITNPCPKPKPRIFDLSRECRDKWEVDRSEIQLKELLGKGNFGEVYKGIFKKHKHVAVKTLKAGTMSVEKFLEEAAIMKKLRHPKIVALYAVCTVGEPIYIIAELMPHGSLLDVLKSPIGKEWIPPQLIDIGAQVADGMSYLELKHHIHRDLAARNVLVGEGDSIKIGDFGLARTNLDNEEMYTAAAGAKFPIKWTAPEACVYGTFSIKSDVWAYGIVLIELFTYGAMPYPGMSNGETIEFLQRGKRHPRPDECPVELYENLILHCWNKDPAERPTFDHIHACMEDFHVFFEGQYT